MDENRTPQFIDVDPAVADARAVIDRQLLLPRLWPDPYHPGPLAKSPTFAGLNEFHGSVEVVTFGVSDVAKAETKWRHPRTRSHNPGGEAVKVSRVKDFATGLSRIIGNLTARYSLGFALAEGEKDDGRLHNLEVRVKAPDAKGKLRKLEVSSRKGYYMSETPEKEKTAAVAQ